MPVKNHLTVNIDPILRDEAEHVFFELGLSADDAIRLFFQQVKLTHKLPFDAEIPNKITRQVFEETDAGQNLIRCQNAEEMFEKLGICGETLLERVT